MPPHDAPDARTGRGRPGPRIRERARARWTTATSPLCGRLRDILGGRRRTWRPDHDRLLAKVRPRRCDRGEGARRPDGIVVPTCRADPHLRPGIRLALELGRDCGRPVVLLCSKDAAGDTALELLGKVVEQVGDVDVLVLTPAEGETSWTRFEVDSLPISRAYRGRTSPRRDGSLVWEDDGGVNDVGRKRNLALLLAVALRWKHVLFLDDDVFARPPLTRLPFRCTLRIRLSTGSAAPARILNRWRLTVRLRLGTFRTLDTATLSAAVRRLEDGSLDAVGWVMRRFDDNSLVHRARAVLGHRQGQFVSGGALVVSVAEQTPFFPLIYNEDWLFVLGYAARRSGGRRIGVAGEVGQEEYEAWTRRRARAEELGDILGEGWATRARSDDRFWVAPATFWWAAFKERIRLREELQAEAAASRQREVAGIRAGLVAVKEVQRVLRPALARQFADYGPVWHADLDRWSTRLHASRSLTADQLLGDASRGPLPGSALPPLAREFAAAHALGSCVGDVHRFLEAWSGPTAARAPQPASDPGAAVPVTRTHGLLQPT